MQWGLLFHLAGKVVPRAKNIFPSLTKIVTLKHSSHYPNEQNLRMMIDEIEKFFSSHDGTDTQC
jgi:hypothetical protein